MIQFVEIDSDQIIRDKMQGYQDAWFKQTGERIILQQTDPVYIYLLADALREIQILGIINWTAIATSLFIDYSIRQQK